MRSALVLFSLVSLTLAVPACGGSAKNDLYGGKSGSGGGSYGQGGAPSGGSGGGQNGGAGGASLGGSAGSGTGGALTGGSGGMPTGGTGGGTTDQFVHCGGSACQVPGDFCCQYLSSGGGYDPTCLITGQTCSNGSEAYCDGPEDCTGGNVCCGQLVQVNNQNYLYNVIKCMPQCDYQQNYRVFCNGNQSACPGGTVCKASSILPDYQVCSTN